MKDIKDRIFEGRQTTFRVSWIDCQDEEGLPISTTILVDSENSKSFADFLNDQEGNIFVHAEGPGVEY